MTKIRFSFFGTKAIFTGKTGHFMVVLSAVTFFLWLGASAILPMLPLYLSSAGTGSFGVGIVMASYYIGAVITQIPSGKLVDLIGPKPVIIMGLLLFGLASLSFAIAHGLFLAVIFRAVQGIGAGAVTVAAIAAVTMTLEEGRKGASLGMIYGSQMMALAVGPVIGSLLGSASLRLLFVAAGLLGIITGLVSGIYFLKGKENKRNFILTQPIPNIGDAYLSLGFDAKNKDTFLEKAGQKKVFNDLEKSQHHKQARRSLFNMAHHRFSFVDNKSYARFTAALLAFGVFGYFYSYYCCCWCRYNVWNEND